MEFLVWLVSTWFTFFIAIPIIIGLYILLISPILWFLGFLWEHKGIVFAVIAVFVVLAWIF